MNSLGMSESILRLIEKRSRADCLIFIGLACCVLILIYVLLYYVKPMIAIW
jgi:hypothetical protein